MRINIIAAVARNRAIGRENKLIYWLPNDMKRFKALTTGHTIIMGRNTYLSLPKGALPNRRNVVLSRTVDSLPGCECYPSLDEALKSCPPNDDVYIIGGAANLVGLTAIRHPHVEGKPSAFRALAVCRETGRLSFLGRDGLCPV